MSERVGYPSHGTRKTGVRAFETLTGTWKDLWLPHTNVRHIGISGDTLESDATFSDINVSLQMCECVADVWSVARIRRGSKPPWHAGHEQEMRVVVIPVAGVRGNASHEPHKRLKWTREISGKLSASKIDSGIGDPASGRAAGTSYTSVSHMCAVCRFYGSVSGVSPMARQKGGIQEGHGLPSMDLGNTATNQRLEYQWRVTSTSTR
ncbi:hypothetical protein GGX14DRAFT_395938 [Mycena pura]|uniref:Uncharacterized protein n=1 Tax=Mycena pura TaxID=153505 RepID=A0AAD6YE30_9AGAR|nr:hypothetical protein GGX14DRAFT_395938 [Mycena pura]